MPHAKRNTVTKTRQNIRSKSVANDNFWDRYALRFLPSFMQGLTWRKLCVSGLLAFAVFWIGLIIIAGEVHTKALETTKHSLIEHAANNGFRVQNITIEGRENVHLEWLEAQLQNVQDAPLFGVDLKTISDNLAQNPWIEAAHVKRIWPHEIKVTLWERTPHYIKASSLNNTRLTLLDKDGTAITPINKDAFSHLPIIYGEKAEKNASALIPLVKAEPLIYSGLSHSEYINERRWDLVLQNGIRIKLPEKDIGLALRKIALAHEQQGLLSRPIDVIDLRDPNRIILEMKKGKNEEFQLTGSGQAL